MTDTSNIRRRLTVVEVTLGRLLDLVRAISVRVFRRGPRVNRHSRVLTPDESSSFLRQIASHGIPADEESQTGAKR